MLECRRRDFSNTSEFDLQAFTKFLNMQEATLEACLVHGTDVEKLLKKAFKFAEEERFVWFISPEPITTLPETLSQPSKEVLKMVTFLYFKDSTELIKHLHSIHTWYRKPELILINHFHVYTSLNSDDYNPVNGAFVCASFLDAGNACVKKLNKSIYLIASVDLDQCKEKSNVQVLLDLYFDKVLSCNDINL